MFKKKKPIIGKFIKKLKSYQIPIQPNNNNSIFNEKLVLELFIFKIKKYKYIIYK